MMKAIVVCIATLVAMLTGCGPRKEASAALAQHHGGQPFWQIRCEPGNRTACDKKAVAICRTTYDVLAMGLVTHGYEARGGAYRSGAFVSSWGRSRPVQAWALDVRCHTRVGMGEPKPDAVRAKTSPATTVSAPAPVSASAPEPQAPASDNPFTPPTSSTDAPMREPPF